MDLVRLSGILYRDLRKNKVAMTSRWYWYMLYYSFKGFLESSKRKHYLFKLVLIFQDEDGEEHLTDKEKEGLLVGMGKKWELTSHVSQIEDMLIKLEFGHTEINYLPDFFGNFRKHVEDLANEDFNDALEELH